ncbi:hypothetical protein ACG33_09305 [Steroidobacter denitrificans]|uniref:Cell division protein FtsX n=2 Tax=Steroidobacter denitrificans TaxID=465721 RepID=A0A127FA44_STEDE|nr:hypothetical protein ACG33_09305 [Steroidobacter denitrificans]
MLGICIGVAALITVLSVMNGLEGELRTRLLNLAAHATVTAEPRYMREWQSLAERIRQMPGVNGVAPFLELQGMVGRGNDLRAAQIRGIEPSLETQVSDVDAYLTSGALSDLQPGMQSIMLGAGLAWALNVRPGDEITVLVPTREASAEGSIAGIDLRPRIQAFIVAGIFEAGAQEHDNALALIHLRDAEALAGSGDAPGGLRLKFADIFAAPLRAPEIAAALNAQMRATAPNTQIHAAVAADAIAAPAAADDALAARVRQGGSQVRDRADFTDGPYHFSDWSVENASYFRAVRIEKTMMALILLLIVAVAAFNIVAALVMVVNEKRTDIAILRTVGIAPRSIVAVFMTQGMVIGWFGTLLGAALGLVLALNVGTIVPFLEGLFGVHVFDPTVFVISEVPAEVRWPQVAGITLTALALTVLATIYPALRGAATAPAEALRYE